MVIYVEVALPSWKQCEDAHKTERASSLEEFIYDNEPAGAYADRWRAELADLIAEAINEDRIARSALNTNPELEPMTYTEYEAAVVKDIIRQTGWTEARARGMTAGLSDFIARGISPTDAASELLHDAVRLG